MVTIGQRSPLSTVGLVLTNLLIPASILIFATGFFPYKPYLTGLARYETLPYGDPPHAPFDKLVFMVVDALRSDFVYAENSGFQFTQSLIRSGHAVPFTANARSPTVTMPRLKSITTGSIPSFVDLILNFDEEDTSSTLAAQDTWLAQIKSQNKGKLLLFGDDTWLKLFPETFDREDGTSSFFVADFTEVDHNVTRNIPGELKQDDWSLMVLHYLGLDHIGHKSGPRSSHMVPKQEEMDGIVREIYEAIQSKAHLQSTLFVLCGDHGMNDAGNHGASSPGETSPALVFISPQLSSIPSPRTAPVEPTSEFEYYTKVEQSDIAPTIAALLGFPVSKNNVGAFIPSFLPFWPEPTDQIQILMRNARQILGIVTAAFGNDSFASNSDVDPCSVTSTPVHDLACQWHKLETRAAELTQNHDIDPAWLDDISTWLREAQELMSSMASNYNMVRLQVGLGMAVTGFIISLTIIVTTELHRSLLGSLLVLLTITYGIMMFASSYVEEEHHFWYWCSTFLIAIVGIRDASRTKRAPSICWNLLALACLRLTRGWNQTGQKFAGNPDIVKTFLITDPRTLWVLILLTYAVAAFLLVRDFRGLPTALMTGLTSTLISSAFAFKLAFTAEDAPELVVGFVKSLHDRFSGPSLVYRARVVFALLGICTAVSVYSGLKGRSRATRLSSVHALHHLYTILAMTQSRATNIPLFLLFTLLLFCLHTRTLSVIEISGLSILFQFVSYFAFGGSNAISSIDLSSAYNGISGFNIIAVGVLTFVSNWAGPIYWTSATNLLLLQKWSDLVPEEKQQQTSTKQRSAGVWFRHAAALTFFTMGSVVGVMAACTALRTHLFIWTVFSPKYLYSMAWSLAQHLIVNLGVGGILFWIGAR